MPHLTDHQRRALPVAERWRAKRREHQEEGRVRARRGDAFHEAGCMLYWAEGTKNRNVASMANSDAHLLRFFRRFLSECFSVPDSDLVVHLNVYSGNGLSIREVEDHWLAALALPRSCLRKHQINSRPNSSKQVRVNKLPYGVCTLRVKRSTPLVQHIFGAIQEYGGFEEPSWLD